MCLKTILSSGRYITTCFMPLYLFYLPCDMYDYLFYLFILTISCGWFVYVLCFMHFFLLHFWLMYMRLHVLRICSYFILQSICVSICYMYLLSCCSLFYAFIALSFSTLCICCLVTHCFMHLFLVYLVADMCDYLLYAFVLILSSVWYVWLPVLCICSYFIS
jgi:hypothetical protein